MFKSRIRRTKRQVRTISSSVFNQPEMIQELDRLNEEYVLVAADKVCNNIVFDCKVYHYDYNSNKLGKDKTTNKKSISRFL
jgi:hypothetical protein